MKKILLPLFAAAMLCSCGNATDKCGDCCDSTSVTNDDSNKTALNYINSDTQMNELFGNVKSATFTVSMAQDFEGTPFPNDDYEDTRNNLFFTPDGEYDLKAEGFYWRLDVPKLKRNNKGQVVTATWYVPDFDTEVSNKYEYDERGMVKYLEEEGTESISEEYYTYDDDSYLVSATGTSAGEGTIYKTNITYKILEKDDHQNWTKRVAKIENQSGPDDGSDTYPDSEVYYEVHSRVIEYYK